MRSRLVGLLVMISATAFADPSAKDVLAAETDAFAKAKPVFERACGGCHTQGAKNATAKKLDHFDMTSYPFGGHHAATIGMTVRTVLGLGNKKATMPSNKPGSIGGDDLAAIKTWIEAWEAADKAGAHPKPAHAHHHAD
jgi:mono/diheme cytochrome c family protein